MSKIEKSSVAPEGDINVSIGQVSFTVGDGTAFETDDHAVLEDASNEKFLTVTRDEPKVEEPQAIIEPTEPIIEPVNEAVVSEETPVEKTDEGDVKDLGTVEGDTDEPITETQAGTVDSNDTDTQSQPNSSAGLFKRGK